MELYRSLVAWTGYSGYVVASYDVGVRTAMRDLRRTADRLTILHRASTVAETKARVQGDVEYLQAEEEKDAVENVRILAASIYEDLNHSAGAVSRELTRRTSQGRLESRNDRFNA